MHRTKKIVLSGLGCLLLSALAGAAFLATAGDDFYRWAMRQAIATAIDREIHVDGSFSFDFGAEPTLIVTDLWVENAPWADRREIARAERIEVQIALWPLLSGIVRVPRLVVDGLTLGLETSAEGVGNWEVASASINEEDRAILEDPAFPLFEFLSLKELTITHRDRRTGQDTEVVLDFLHKSHVANDAALEYGGEGRLNDRPFQFTWRSGSIEQALAATTPYPMALMLQSSSLFLELTGTAENLLEADGLDLSLDVRMPAIQEVLRTLEVDLPLVGRAEASAHLRGNLESLVVEEIDLEVIDRFGQEFRAEGSLADLINGERLDLRFTGELGPAALRWAGELPTGLSDVLDGVARLDFVGRITGDLEAPVVEDLHARLEHGTGADLSLQGRVALDLSEGGAVLTEFETTILLSLPNPTILERALDVSLPELGAIHATAILSWFGDWLVLRSAEAEAGALEQLQLKAEGQIGKLSGKDLGFELDPRIDLSATIERSRPLVYFLEALVEEIGPTTDPLLAPSAPAPQPSVPDLTDELVLLIQQGLKSAGFDPGHLDGILSLRTRIAIENYQAYHGLEVDGRATESLLRRLQGASGTARRQSPSEPQVETKRVSELAEALPELGPVTGAVRLSREGDAFRLEDLNLTIGTEGALRVDVTGTLGALGPERNVALEEIALAASFTVPSSEPFAGLLPPKAPEFRNLKGRFAVQGTTETLSISGADVTAEGPDGMVAAVASQVVQVSLEAGFEIKDLALDLDARWPNTEGVNRLVGLDLPGLGPVWARATLRNRGETFALSEITVTAGSPDQPTARVTGEIGDLLAVKRVDLSGEFDVKTATLLGKETATPDVGLGIVHGRFELSDRDGSIGLEALSADIENSQLLSLSIKGLFDDIAQGDELRMRAALAVPNVAQLGREFGFEFPPIGTLSFKGEVSGSDENFRAEGEARFGETDVSGTLAGTLVGERPALRAKLYSPLFRLVDVGLVPRVEAPEPKLDAAAKDKAQAKASSKRLRFGEALIPFEALKDFDLDLDVLFEGLEGVQLDFDSIEGRLDVVDGVLRIDPLSLIFGGGRIDSTLLVDSRGESPEVHLGLVADDVDLGDFLSQVEAEVPLDGELDLIVDLKATGNSPRALAFSLEGEFDLAVERGHVRTSLLRLTTINPVSWLFSEDQRKGYSDLNCLILRLDFKDGVAKSETLVLDTTNVRALGAGRIDLRDELVDIAFSPEAKKKRLIAMSTPFVIEGPLAGPRVKVDSVGASARMAGEVLLGPLNLLGSLLPFVSDRGKDKDNPCLTLQDGLSHRR